ncbi:uncharacterized protein LOC142632132 [Castanea sativa]|uniref:uncharacterized protein LOC142632132 n=1 Tax=Castanea sativa TaxID=21020 RepID=UPI003F652E48
MPETHPPENQLNGVVVGGPNTPLVLASSDTTTTTTTTTVGSKRQRRPSVRLGDIGGDQPYDSHVRRTAHNHTHNNNSNIISSSNNNNNNNNISNSNSKHWKLTMKDPTNSNSNSNSNSNNPISDVDEREGNLDSVAIGSWKVKDSKRRGLSAKRVRSNWVSRADECGIVGIGGGGVGGGVGGGSGSGGNGNGGAGVEGDEKYSGGEDIDDGYREFDVENSESPLKEQSPIHSLENLGVDGNERELVYRRPFRGGGGVRENIDGVELSGPSDSGDRNENGGGGRRGKCGEDGVRIWLNGLGLSRYAPVFEIHEVDDEVLPMLTLEDLKDMGINAVGSRRKMYCAIQKLGKGFS